MDSEEKPYSDPIPTKCKNDVGHSFNSNSLHIQGPSELVTCYVKPLSGTENHGTTGLNTESMTLKDVARRLYVLERCAILRGLLKEI